MLKSSPHYVSYDRLPQISEEDSTRDAFRVMSEANVGSLVVRAGARPRCYVSGTSLKRAFVELTPSLKPPIRWETLTMRSLLSESAAGASGQLARVLREKSDIVRRAISPIVIAGTVSINEEARPLQDRSDAVFLVLDDSRQPVGWFLNHESVMAILQTAPPVFICKNGHRNPDPDNGRCYYCPAPIP